MRAVIVIPARHESSRFPGKVLAARTGWPLIRHVYEQARRAATASRVIVAADVERILDAVRAFGGEAVMTRREHPNGTSRIAEVAVGLDEDIVVNVQGDEPELDPHLVDRAVEALDDDGDCVASTIATPFAAGEDPGDPNIVKVVLDARGRALYFSRAAIPYPRRDGADASTVPPLRHVGLYAYRRSFLPTYVSLPETPLERTERLEQLRILEHGHEIAVVIADSSHAGVDTPEQYEAFVRRWAGGGAPGR